MRKYIILVLMLVILNAYGENTSVKDLGTKETPSVTAMAGEQIKWQVLSSGGSRGISTNYVVSGTVGQTAAGTGTSTNYKVSHGYWQNFAPASCCVKAGDANNNGTVNALDVTFIINFLYKHGPAPVCPAQADVNGNGVTNALDVTYLINFLYKHGPAPKCP